MGCATGIVKYLVFLANLLFALAGLAMIIIGIIYKFNYHDATEILPRDFGMAPILSIIVGAIVFITAFLGCCGAVKESPCMLTTYAIILLTIFIIQVAVAVYAFLQIKDPDQFRNAVRTNLQKAFDAYDRDEKAKEGVDVIQRWFQCCGLDHPTERQFSNGSLPLSCCKPNLQSCRITDYNSVYDRGCNEAVINILEGNLQVVAGAAIGIALIELSCCGLDGPDGFTNATLPNSCCSDVTSMSCTRQNPTLHHDGCYEKLFDTLQTSSEVIGGVIIGIAAAEIIGAIFGLCLASSIRNQYRRSLYA